jgi:hypothetical protein
MSDVKPGQIWTDTDKRSRGRHVRVVAITGSYATVEDVAYSPADKISASLGGRIRRIRLDRFRPAYYRLVEDTPEPNRSGS